MQFIEEKGITEWTGHLSDQFSELSWDKKGLLLLLGKRGFWVAHALCSHFLRLGFRVYIVDCAIRFNVFHISENLEFFGEDVDDMLERILIQRAFTPYQILDSTFEIEKLSKQNFVFIYLAPMKQFFDGDVKTNEGSFLLHRLIQRYTHLRNLGVPLIIAEKEKYSSPIFSGAKEHLQQIASKEWNLVSQTLPLGFDLFGNPYFKE